MAALLQALPKAPPKEGQMVKEPTMLHTTIARLLQPPDQVQDKVWMDGVGLAGTVHYGGLTLLMSLCMSVWH